MFRDAEVQKMSGWIGVDLDGTLAEYGDWKGPVHIGLPVPAMAARVRRWLIEGRDVRIFTARVSDDGSLQGVLNAGMSRVAIEDWCVEHLGQKVPITATKDFEMIELWDDRCVQVVPNTGKRADGKEDER
jgi:hypothetical protein